ncbi:MAG TPA: hypothetical protein VE262_04730 [Blastocatellia bacterium]|nr:hypothetical protein [Blastocatellia bacterium]
MKSQANLSSLGRAEGAVRPSLLARSTALAALIYLAVLLAPAPPAASGAATQQPEVVLDKTSIDYGEIFQGEELLTLFRVRNAGQELLQLSETPLLPSKQAASFRESRLGPLPVSASLLIPSPT